MHFYVDCIANRKYSNAKQFTSALCVLLFSFVVHYTASTQICKFVLIRNS